MYNEQEVLLMTDTASWPLSTRSVVDGTQTELHTMNNNFPSQIESQVTSQDHLYNSTRIFISSGFLSSQNTWRTLCLVITTHHSEKWEKLNKNTTNYLQRMTNLLAIRDPQIQKQPRHKKTAFRNESFASVPKTWRSCGCFDPIIHSLTFK